MVVALNINYRLKQSVSSDVIVTPPFSKELVQE